MKQMKLNIIAFALFFALLSHAPAQDKILHGTRHMSDTVGFTSKAYQMEAFMKYVNDNYSAGVSGALEKAGIDDAVLWKTIISPHDDYSFVGYVYPALFRNLKAKTVIIIGVCHKAKQFNLDNKIIFDSFDYWEMPYGPVRTSNLRNALIKNMNPDYFIVHDSVQAAEHSVEAVTPFIQHNNRDAEIISILVPYMPYERMNEISVNLSEAIQSIFLKNNMEWGRDFAVVISNDAVHYGDDDWGGKNYAPYGADTAGYKLAVEHEYEIINNCLAGEITTGKIKKFSEYTLNENNYRDYKWTWCGRYSVPFGLLISYYLQKYTDSALSGRLIKYATSIDHPHIPVRDFGMGVTAPAGIRHWVGYAAIGYK